jgi:hypothetical protein
MEVWKDLIEFGGVYQVSDLGRIKSLARYSNSKAKRYIKEKMLKQSLNNRGKGYYYVCLADLKNHYVHRLVAKAFIKNEFNKPCINHIDGEPQNNRVENLEWCTHKENIQHAIQMGLTTFKEDVYKGENNPKAKLKKHDIIEIRSFPRTFTNVFIGKLYKVSDKTISAIRLRRYWKHI